MRIALVNAPGRFPTVSHDAGAWWDALATTHELFDIAANTAWWRHVAGPDIFQDAATFASDEAYLRAVAALDDRLTDLNGRREALDHISLAEGPRVRGLDYDDSRAIVDFAFGDSPLSRDIEASLAQVGPLDLALVRVTSAVDLLTAAIVAKVLRRRNPGLHVCLADHGYENFSLTPHLASLRASGALEQAFDTVVAEKDEIDAVVPDLVARLTAGEAVRGVLYAGPGARAPRAPVRPALGETFSPTPVVQLRLSPAGCYWGRCVYCTQNAKYAGSGAPSKAALAHALERVAAYVAVGCRTFVFSDEAVSPAMLRALSQAILARGLDIAWTCRSKLERAFNAALIGLAAQAGCREILFGLESASPDLLRKMDKHVPGQTMEEAAAIFRAMAQAGVGLHLNLINGFPGESLDEAWDTADFTVRALRAHPNATFGLNPFTVFPSTPIAADPARFGIAALSQPGDMPSLLPHRLEPAARRRTGPARAAFGDLQAEMERRLGWDDLTAAPGGRSAFELYSASGHGVVFKCQAENPIDRRRAISKSPTRRPIPRRRRAFLTGATGAVGSAVLAELRAGDWDVLAMVRDPAVDLGCATLVADLYDLPPLDEALAGMDAIIHCASPRSLDRQAMLVGEVDATGRLLDAWSTGAFVYASSQTVYGLPQGVLTETAPLSPDNWYDLAKATNEQQVAFTTRALGGVGVSLRLPLVLSSSHRAGAGNYLIPLFETLQRGEAFVFADRRAMDEHGTVYIGAEDLGAAMVRAAEATESGAYNLAGGFVTWRRLIEALGEAAGVTPRVLVGDHVGFALPRSRTEYDVGAFEAASGFRPTTSLEASVEAFVRAQAASVVVARPAELEMET